MLTVSTHIALWESLGDQVDIHFLVAKINSFVTLLKLKGFDKGLDTLNHGSLPFALKEGLYM